MPLIAEPPPVVRPAGYGRASCTAERWILSSGHLYLGSSHISKGLRAAMLSGLVAEVVSTPASSSRMRSWGSASWRRAAIVPPALPLPQMM